MRVDDLPAEELRQEVAAALLGPEGRDCPQISRVSWFRSLMKAVKEASVTDAIIALDGDTDPEAVMMMRSECIDLLAALERLVAEEPKARRPVPFPVGVPRDIADAIEDLPF